MNLRFGVPETGLLAHRTVPALLAPAELIPGHRRDVDALLAWGRRPSARRVERLGRRWQLPVWQVACSHCVGKLAREPTDPTAPRAVRCRNLTITTPHPTHSALDPRPLV